MASQDESRKRQAVRADLERLVNITTSIEEPIMPIAQLSQWGIRAIQAGFKEGSQDVLAFAPSFFNPAALCCFTDFPLPESVPWERTDVCSGAPMDTAQQLNYYVGKFCSKLRENFPVEGCWNLISLSEFDIADWTLRPRYRHLCGIGWSCRPKDSHPPFLQCVASLRTKFSVPSV
ncbi:hypothetical protein IFM53868_06527 [Aspergillus udagawae]|uniref:Uncharacterized protein n=1 Tax=Aspergillus udagawae TaxID=91492 RepID=A0ABQ1B0I6_9EURO|nr:hypothetical protein IFM53868_06527 [Aspergillus udagawae]GFG21018.1 hypothetical protein IFM5058_10881 [Aspergillus udagawae]